MKTKATPYDSSDSIKRQLFAGKDAVRLSLNVRRTLLWLVYASHQAMEAAPTAVVSVPHIYLDGRIHEAPVTRGEEHAFRFTFVGTLAGEKVEFSVTLKRSLFKLTWNEYTQITQHWRPGLPLLTPVELSLN